VGWSCARDAGATTDAWSAACIAQTGSQNVWEQGGGPAEFNMAVRYFFEISNTEHADGAITGKIFRFVGVDSCRPVSSFRVEPDGRVSRAPKWLKEAAKGARPRFPANALPGSGGPR